jgi:DNA-binding NtrC family response regulator
VHSTVSAEVVVTPEEFSERPGSHAYDLVVAELTSPDWRETQTLELLHLSKSQIPLIFVGGTMQRETVVEFITRGAYDCIEMGRIGHLPVAVHRALDKGVFVTTSYFTQPAQNFAERHPFKIVLIDGERLAALMIRHNVGVRIDETLYLKKMDEDFFVDE